ncbi:hypothetical protein SAMN05660420_01962 [Desulfuromusa kysingii]|uniref:HAD family hydrolase n=1 Tax=Desulfuromusa kysingii TaxID=37625 RepID=A0A1H4ASD9_9BACT|nr:HAD-IIB family hydrolase [Desulfuromusa kysingii]SEA38809.1 hypothetical protein SAMN05660420_01962 [Desulfuromusa kysingii]
MQPLKDIAPDKLKQIKYVLADIDDTLTLNGRLPAAVYMALEKLHDAGIILVPITGRPAGWCDHMARMWPIDGIVGENGAFYFCYRTERQHMLRRYWKADAERQTDRARLLALSDEILTAIPEARVAADQAYRETDLAIDICEDVAPLSTTKVNRIMAMFTAAGAHAKISSIHVNGWFGDYDKLSMTRNLFLEVFNEDLEAVKGQVIFIGDSPNDMPMFDYFPESVGVANITRFLDQSAVKPAWITTQEGGTGFLELAAALLRVKRQNE